jgi:hypothetical protein
VQARVSPGWTRMLTNRHAPGTSAVGASQRDPEDDRTECGVTPIDAGSILTP